MKKLFLIVNTIIAVVIITITLIFPRVTFSQNNNLNSHPDFRLLIDFLKILFNFNIQTPTSSPTLNPELNPISPAISPLPNTNYHAKYVYYPQCGGAYDNYSYPPNCTLCDAGCGPTTVAMILASYVDKKFNPASVSDLYKQTGFGISCQGTNILEAKTIIEKNGLITSDIFNYSSLTNQEAIKDMRMYLKNGWTLFTLARFCNNYCDHFFWIVNIDEVNNVWAYDPYYGRKQLPPLNLNVYFPYPKYRYAFGIKKL